MIIVGRKDAADHFALVGLAGGDCKRAVIQLVGSSFKMVEPQTGLARGGIGAMTREAVFRKNGPDVAVVFDTASGGSCLD